MLMVRAELEVLWFLTQNSDDLKTEGLMFANGGIGGRVKDSRLGYASLGGD